MIKLKRAYLYTYIVFFLFHWKSIKKGIILRGKMKLMKDIVFVSIMQHRNFAACSNVGCRVLS